MRDHSFLTGMLYCLFRIGLNKLFFSLGLLTLDVLHYGISVNSQVSLVWTTDASPSRSETALRKAFKTPIFAVFYPTLVKVMTTCY